MGRITIRINLRPRHPTRRSFPDAVFPPRRTLIRATWSSGSNPSPDGEGAQGQFGGYGAYPPDIAEPPGDEVVFEPGVLGQEDRHPGRQRRPSRTKQGVSPRPEGPEDVRGEEGQRGQFEDRRGR